MNKKIRTRRRVFWLSKKACLLVQHKEMPSCYRHVFLFNKKRCLICSTRRHALLFNKKTCLLVQQEDISSSLGGGQEDVSSRPTRRHVFLMGKKTCLPAQQEDMHCRSTRRHVFLRCSSAVGTLLVRCWSVVGTLLERCPSVVRALLCEQLNSQKTYVCYKETFHDGQSTNDDFGLKETLHVLCAYLCLSLVCGVCRMTGILGLL